MKKVFLGFLLFLLAAAMAVTQTSLLEAGMTIDHVIAIVGPPDIDQPFRNMVDERVSLLRMKYGDEEMGGVPANRRLVYRRDSDTEYTSEYYFINDWLTAARFIWVPGDEAALRAMAHAFTSMMSIEYNPHYIEIHQDTEAGKFFHAGAWVRRDLVIHVNHHVGHELQLVYQFHDGDSMSSYSTP